MKFDKEKTLFEKISTGIGILLSVFFSFLGLSEFYIIRVMKQTESYPFGGEGPVPYYYRTAELYSFVNLTYGVAFAALTGIAIWNWKRNKISGFVTFGLTLILILIQLFHGLQQ